MTTPNTTNTQVEAPEANQEAATSQKPKATKKARGGARKPRVAAAKAKATHKASPAKKATKGHTGGKAAKPGKGGKGGKKAAATAGSARPARDGSKTANILDLLRRSGGAKLSELMNATGWQAHSVRGFISGTVGKKMGLAITSAKGKDGERTYLLKG